MIKGNIKAFTIMEMTVAMLIASIVIAITYTIYTIVVGSYTSFNYKNNNMAVVMRVNELLKKDFAHADMILKNQNGFLFRSMDKTINYEIQPDFIVRTGSTIDTLKVRTDSLITNFEGNAVYEISDDEERNRVDDIGFIILYENEKIPYNYHKQYSSVNLIQRNTNAFN